MTSPATSAAFATRRDCRHRPIAMASMAANAARRDRRRPAAQRVNHGHQRAASALANGWSSDERQRDDGDNRQRQRDNRGTFQHPGEFSKADAYYRRMDALDRYRDEFPILVAHGLHDQQLARRDAAADRARTSPSTPTRGRRAACARGKSAGGRCRSRSATRSRAIIGAPAGIGQHARERHDRAHGRAVVAAPVRDAQADRLLGDGLPVDGATSIARSRPPGSSCASCPAEDDLTVGTERMLDAIDDTTAVVAFSHVLFRTSYIMDAARDRRARARRPARAVILDTYQSAGIIPVDVTALGVDFAVGGCLKWLCGGPGNAFLYTRPDRLKTAQPVVHRLAVAPRIRSPSTSTTPSVRDDAMHMMNGTPSIPAYYAALAGLDIINEVGVDRIREQSKRMTARLLALVDEYGFTSAAVARSRAPRRHRRRECARRAARVAHAQGARLRRRLPAAGRRPHLAALLQHDGRDRSRSWRRWRRSWRRRTTRRRTRCRG